MENKTEIKKIVLQLGKKEVELTVEECKKLKEVLSEMFGKEVVREVHHDHWNRWYWDSPRIYCSTGLQATAQDSNKFLCGSSSFEYKADSNSLFCSIQ